MTRLPVAAPLHPVAPPPGVPLRVPMHPGRFLQKYFLTPMRLTQTDAAQRLGISRRRLNEVIQGHRSLTPDTAIRCALLFGGDTTFWLQLQSAHDCYYAWKQCQGGHQDAGQPRGSHLAPASASRRSPAPSGPTDPASLAA